MGRAGFVAVYWLVSCDISYTRPSGPILDLIDFGAYLLIYILVFKKSEATLCYPGSAKINWCVQINS